DFNIYLFSKNHHLLSRQNILIGSEVGDHPNNPMSGFRTTPGGLYETGNKFEKSQNNEMFFDKYGTHYIVLIPLNGQYDMTEKYTMGIHGTYEKDPSRDFKIKSENSKDRRTSNGCINLEDATFGEIYNHLILGSTLYITNEPSNQDIEKFLTKNK
ncbi:MAG TPA: L,D-transpeptidase, partial [Candidatus Absconditabacterales bacterium]|nr:L,D-transpeptidase [Candidatus Absconditabacterales bacterium]